MPSPFEQTLAANLSQSMYPSMGLPATYTAPDGTVTSGLTIRVHREAVREVDRPNRAAGEAQSGEVMVLASALIPVKGGRFVVEGVEVWTVAMTPVLKNLQYGCTCTRSGVERVGPMRAKD